MNRIDVKWRTTVAGLAGALALVFTAAPASAIIIDDTPPPAVTASPNTGLIDGQTITFSGSNFSYGQPVTVQQCSQDLLTCSAPTVVTTTTNGSFSTETTVRRRIGPNAVDCAAAAGACVLAVQYDGASHATASLTFTASK